MERTHGQVERVPRWDSFAGSALSGVATVALSNGFGGGQRFFLCPRCGVRARFLYRTAAGPLCRRCARLNYRSQQGTRSPFDAYHGACAYAARHLVPLDGSVAFSAVTPARPAGMRRATYARHLARFDRLRERFFSQVSRVLLKDSVAVSRSRDGRTVTYTRKRFPS